MGAVDETLKDARNVLLYLRSRYPMYHMSNVFFRDVQYGLRAMLQEHGESIGYQEAERVARSFIERMEREKIFRRIDGQSWTVDYPEFRTVPAPPAPQGILPPPARKSNGTGTPSSAGSPPAPAAAGRPGEGKTST